MRKRKPTIRKLKQTLDKLLSEYVRKRDKGVCISCGVTKHWKLQQNGHYISRMHNATRYDERNNNCQCVGCNVFKHGAMDVYALNLQSKYGEGILRELNRLKTQVKQFTVKELETMIENIKEKLKSI